MRCHDAYLFQSCSTTIQAYIAGNSEPQAMWLTLKNLVDNASYENGPILLRDRLQKVRYNGEGSISTFISKVLAFRDQLAHTPQALTDNEITTHLITHLPKSWRSIRDLISYQPADNKTLDYVINALTKYEAEHLDDEDE